MSRAAVADRVAEAQSAALHWYAANGRDLAFRRTTDPWAILVSEVMAQQTQAARAADAWSQFMAQFPTPATLAGASAADVIRAWRGLGYNRRAVALRNAANAIVHDHGGRVPENLEALQCLPGIGPYTARAILAIAFDRPVAALDVNIRRVLGRAFLDGNLPAGEFQSAADALVPAHNAAAWTHALMDIGAAFCRPRDPRCDLCPLQATCAYASKLPEDRARKALTTRSPDTVSSPMRFESTTRWLRGRILDRLRDTPAGEWTAFGEPMGVHDQMAVEASVSRLAAEGMIELVDGRARLAP
jgi:A/G-specific adenine glycosylase